MRSFYVVAPLVLLLAVGGGVGYRRYESGQLAPFSLGEIRVGMRFSALDAQAWRGLHRRYACRDVEARVRLCEVETDGPPGTLRVVVDDAGRAAMVQFRVRDTTLKMVEQARQLSARWSLVRPPHRLARRGASVAAATWQSEDRAWSASMLYAEPTAKVPTLITLVDERRLTRTEDASARVLLRLAGAGLLDGVELRAALARTTASALSAGAREISAPGRALAAAALALPPSPPQGGDALRPYDNEADDRGAGAEMRRIAEQAIALAYPGTHLELADRSYLVDGAGAAEEIDLKSATWKGGVAFAVSFPRRWFPLKQELRAFDAPAPRHRAEADILLATRDSTTGAVVGVRRVSVDGEALTTRVTSIDVLGEDPPGAPILVVEYEAAYRTPRWFGEVAWLASFTPDSAGELRAVERLPVAFTKKESDGRESEGLLSDEDGAPAGFHYLSAARVGAAAALPGLLVLPDGPLGMPSGWMLLDLL